jgi:hypothetical protein
MIPQKRKRGVTGLAKLSLVCASVIIAACSMSAPIQPATTSRSAVEGAGQTISILPRAPDTVAYRVFNQGSSGFVSMQSVREEAERRANQFCGQRGKAMESLEGTVASAPYVWGHVPRIEIVFDCVEFGHIVDDTYERLFDLKKRFDSGIMTKAEFDREKARILAEP